jgi:hypothetical protein
LTGLVKKIEQRLEAAAGKTPRALGAYILFDSNADGLADRLRSMAAKESLKRVFLGIGAAPQDYAVSSDAEVTVVIYTPNRRWEQRVTANFAFRKGMLDDAKSDAIVRALADVLPK